MLKIIKNSINTVLNKLGFEIKHLSQYSNFNLQFIKSLKYHNIDFLIDVGANEGQFAMELRNSGYQGQILSFEPLTIAYENLLINSKNDKYWSIAEKCAIGNQIGEIEINVSENSVSSSILNMLEKHSMIASDSKYFTKEVTKINTIDSKCLQYIEKYNNVFLKIDTQGYEWEVLNGATESLKQIKGLMCELSFENLYDGQKLWLEIIDRLTKIGFEIWAIDKAFINTKDGKLMQIDAVFFRNN
jgi:FkbM family methyltransferase